MQLFGERLVACVSATRNRERLMAKSKGHSASVRALRSGVSFVAISALAASAPAFGQPAPNPPSTGAISNSTSPNTSGNAIIVTGIRQSLRNSQQIKRNSDTIVDAITAQDIGALPDRSVTEA